MVNLDILIIGAGTAGEDAAKAARRNVDSVGVVEKGVVGGHRSAEAVGFEADRTDLALANSADHAESLLRGGFDAEFHGEASKLSGMWPCLVASSRPASSRARSTPPNKSESARASRIIFSTG